jgi:hypothetical protein
LESLGVDEVVEQVANIILSVEYPLYVSRKYESLGSFLRWYKEDFIDTWTLVGWKWVSKGEW